MIDTPMEKYRDAITKTLSDLISINSVKDAPSLNMPYGKGVFTALMYMLDTAEKLDLESFNLFGHMGYATYGSGKEILAILTHLDVVPAGEGWDTPPFRAVVKDGKLFGRGAVDNKGAAVAALFALYAIKQSCITLNREVRIMFGCDEESGWADMDFYKANYPLPDMVVSPDASFPIYNSEKGLLHLTLRAPIAGASAIKRIRAGNRPNIVPNKAECLLDWPVELVNAAIAATGSPARFCAQQTAEGTLVLAEGVSAHGAHPEQGVNALTHLIRLLCSLGLPPDGLQDRLCQLNEKIGLEIDGASLGIRQADDISGALSLNFGALHVENGQLVAKIDIRTPIYTDVQALYAQLRTQFSTQGFAAEVIHMQEPHHVPEDAELVCALKRVYEKCMGEPAKCLCCAGATYARAFENGVAFGPVAPGKDACEHGPNEYIEIDDVIKLAEVLAYAILELAATENDLI